jgi:hypothetical protein
MHKKKTRRYIRGLIDRENLNTLEQLSVCIILLQMYNPETEFLSEAYYMYKGKFLQHLDFTDKDCHKRNCLT